MSQSIDQFDQKLKSSSARSWVTMIACFTAGNLFEHHSWGPFILGFTLVWMAGQLIEYWIPPRPPYSFRVWFTKVLTLFTLILNGLWILPKALSTVIWAPLAYALPTFALVISTYWLAPLYPIRRTAALWKHIIWSLGISVVFGILGHIAPYE